MSLDQNLFTLFFTPNPSYPAGTVVDLTDGSGTIHYRKRRIVSQQQIYRIEVCDPLSEALLASATAPSATSKHKTLELYNPSNVVELKYSGTLSFRWSFKWETHEFEWKREECFIIRKPDPPVLVAVTKEPPGRIRTASVQILDYNLNRFDVEDRKGLEIVLLTALLTFQDASDVYHEPNTTATATPSTSPTSPVPHKMSASGAPPPPPKPAPKKGIERIAELQLSRGQVNEVTVLEEGAITDYAKHCARLLQDDAMLFISVRSADANQVPKVLRVAEETKRLWYKAGMSLMSAFPRTRSLMIRTDTGDTDLHQYVLYDTKEGIHRVINLDNKGRGKNKEYAPPKSLTVHLSKIDMPELRPRGTPLDNQQTTRDDQDSGKRRDKNQSKHVKAKDKDRDRDKDGRLKQTSPPPRRSTSPPHPVLHKFRSQYFQPKPSPPLQSVPGPQRYAPPMPPRTHALQQHSQGMPRRRSMYGSLNAVQDQYYYDYEVQREDMSSAMSPGNSSSNSGLLGRLLGR
ncbi:hypothetical protein HD554DRAFT_2012186 [Boletus coccyginus]|nr:hypothetical protein HD554DRAFT_2012186 [Boletus coccyginus]